MPQNEDNLPSFTHNKQLAAADLQSLADAIKRQSRYFSDTLNEGTGIGDGSAWQGDTFVGVVVSEPDIDDEDDAGNTDYTAEQPQTWIARAVTKNTLNPKGLADEYGADVDQFPGLSETVTASNMAMLTHYSTAKPPVGTIVQCFTFYDRGESTAVNERTPTKWYVYWWQAGPMRVRIGGAGSGTGKYYGDLLRPPNDDISLTTPLATTDEGNANANVQIVILNWSEVGGDTRRLDDGSVWNGELVRVNNDGTLVIGINGSPQLDCWVVVSSPVSGGGAKYNATILQSNVAAADVALTGDATAADVGSTVGGTDCLLIDTNEIGRENHAHYLSSSYVYPARLLRVNTDGTIVVTTASAPVCGEHFAVTVSQNGGADGGSGSPATYTYDVTTSCAGELLNGDTPKSVAWSRPNGSVVAGTHGTAHYEGATLILDQVDEVPNDRICTTV